MKSNPVEQWIINVIFIAVTLFCLIPFILLITSSITSETEIVKNGYSLIPAELSFESYMYLFKDPTVIVRAYGISILVTIVGTLSSLIIMTLLAYPLSRKEMPMRNFLAFFVFFTMLFNGGLVPTYLMYTNLFNMKNTIWALIVPGALVNAFFVILIRTFFSMNVPKEVIESAYMDGAGEFKIFTRIVIPLSTPVLGAVGLFQLIHYWNDWFNGLIYITDERLYSIQVLLNTILLNAQYLLNNVQFSDDLGQTGQIPGNGLKMAIAAIGVIPILITYPFFKNTSLRDLQLVQ